MPWWVLTPLLLSGLAPSWRFVIKSEIHGNLKSNKQRKIHKFCFLFEFPVSRWQSGLHSSQVRTLVIHRQSAEHRWQGWSGTLTHTGRLFPKPFHSPRAPLWNLERNLGHEWRQVNLSHSCCKLPRMSINLCSFIPRLQSLWWDDGWEERETEASAWSIRMTVNWQHFKTTVKKLQWVRDIQSIALYL